MANPGVLFCLEEALHSLEISLNQIICYTWFGSDTLKLKSIRAGLRKLNLVEDRAIARMNHFGVYVIYFFNLPAPIDQIPTNMSPVKIVPTSMAKEFAGVNV
ncbi:hypothetical protein Ahy_B09g096246 [Arachis hypogaea]|uniref:Uncharacterized protein n=1 Tax=Arachis hypogaea TaxID=3818 RepID=A0A444XJD6_ARAHY|nr:hypothetical protein Ahy_B09g096246 [Arachis hypogaea]